MGLIDSKILSDRARAESARNESESAKDTTILARNETVAFKDSLVSGLAFSIATETDDSIEIIAFSPQASVEDKSETFIVDGQSFEIPYIKLTVED